MGLVIGIFSLSYSPKWEKYLPLEGRRRRKAIKTSSHRPACTKLQPIETDTAGPFQKRHSNSFLLHNGKPSKKEERFREWRAVAVSTKTWTWPRDLPKRKNLAASPHTLNTTATRTRTFFAARTRDTLIGSFSLFIMGVETWHVFLGGIFFLACIDTFKRAILPFILERRIFIRWKNGYVFAENLHGS